MRLFGAGFVVGFAVAVFWYLDTATGCVRDLIARPVLPVDAGLEPVAHGGDDLAGVDAEGV